MTEENKTPENADTSANTEAPAEKKGPIVNIGTKDVTVSDTPAPEPATEPSKVESPKVDAPVPKAATAKPVAEAATKEEPVEEKPDPKKVAAQEKLDFFKSHIVKRFGEDVLEEALLAKYQPTFVIKREHWLEVATFLQNDEALAFDYPEVMAGTDYPAHEYIEVVLYLYSMKHGYFITIKTRTPREAAEVPSLTPIYNGVNWEEREIFDLLGIHFSGHPDLRRIMMPEDYEGYPLRKDFSVWGE